jgi:hypothetical protein
LLHNDGQQLIEGWLRRARVNIDCANRMDCFEAFIYAWIAFNSWAVFATGKERDTEWKNRLIQSRELQLTFMRLVADTGSRLHVSAYEFAEWWPIFKAQALRVSGITIRRDDLESRREVVDFYLHSGARLYQPACWKRHIDAGEAVPVDWPHTLETLYRVRCNLFHGEKSVQSETDRTIVHLACNVLLDFIDEGELLGYRHDWQVPGRVPK